MNIFSCVDNKNIEKIFILFYSCYVNCSDKDKIKFYLLTLCFTIKIFSS